LKSSLPAKEFSMLSQLPDVTLSTSAMSVLLAAERAGRLSLVGSIDELVALAVPETAMDPQGFFTVGYDVPGRGFVVEAQVCRVRNGVAANYVDPTLRRRDPDCLVIADDQATDKPTFRSRFGRDFDGTRRETLDWLASQPLAAFFFETGMPGRMVKALAICPANAGFFALGLAMLQGIVPLERVRAQAADYFHTAVVYTAPVFRHTHFDGRQVVVHNRRFETAQLHELFSYNLYPGPSAKKGVYGMLLTIGERDEIPWTTAHCSTVRVVTPYENVTTIMHEGASGGGKSEMLEAMHREPDGRMHLGTNVVTGEGRWLTLPQGCELQPVTDDMAICHPALMHDDPGLPAGRRKLTLVDAEQSWFIRVNHITRYGTDPHLESLTIHPPGPLLFLNIAARPGSTALIWEPVEDAPGVPCPNPRVIVPRASIPGIVNESVDVHVRSFGVRCPPCTSGLPTYGILGLFHVLPPALAWLWRLVAPRGHGNPSIEDQEGMQSEGVGSYWPFATGRQVDQANILLRQIVETASTLFVLIPNQHVGSWQVGFAPQWIFREYVARRGAAHFRGDEVVAARCPLLGYHRRQLHVEGQTIDPAFFDVAMQPEVGEAAYQAGAAQLTAFFRAQLTAVRHADLDPLGRRIIDACLNGATAADYAGFTPP
jgi:hypothetical protein